MGEGHSAGGRRRGEDDTRIRARLAWAAAQPEGRLFAHTGGLQPVYVDKIGHRLILRLFDHSSEVQSELDLQHPLHLTQPYTARMMLALLWNDAPRRAHVIGLGGGRVPLVLRQRLPALDLRCSEIDPVIADVAERFFAVRSGRRFRILIGDGRAQLARRRGPPLDMIFVDAFRGAGFSPLRFATEEFLRECHKQLGDTGLAVLNLLPWDPLLGARLATIASVFPETYVLSDAVAVTVLATRRPCVTLEAIRARARELDASQPLTFPLTPFADNLVRYVPAGCAASPLRDAVLPHPPIDEEIRRQLRGDDRCPCGSGDPFALCCPPAADSAVDAPA